MLIDNSLMLADQQTLSAAAAGAKVIDLEQVGRTDMSKQLQVTFVVNANISGTVQFKLQESDSASSGFADCAAAAQLTAPTAGTVVQIPMPYGVKRYLKAYFGGAPTAGKVSAFITIGRQQWQAVAQAESRKKAFVTEQ